MLVKISSGMIGTINIFKPSEDNADISKDAHLALVLQQLEEDEVQNMEDNKLMTIRDGNLSTMMQQQEEDTAKKSKDKEQQEMESMPTGKALILVHHVLSLNHFLQSFITQNLGVFLKVATLEIDSMFFVADRLLRLQAVFRVAVKNSTVDVRYHYTNYPLLWIICTN